MLTHPGPNRRRLPLQSRGFALLIAGAAALGLATAGCFGGDDDDEPRPSASGSIVTIPAGNATSTATTQPAVTGGTLVPAPSATPTPAVAVSPPVQVSSEVAAMLDLAPCADQAHYQVQTFDAGIPALTYKDVPEGTPIVFPFEEGRLRQADARADAIVIVYEVEGVGFLTVQSSGANSLDRLVAHPVAGTVIGHFGPPFEREATHVFNDYQLFATVGTAEQVIVGDQLISGQALNLEVKDCVVLP